MSRQLSTVPLCRTRTLRLSPRVTASPVAPVLFGLTSDRGRARIFDLHPMRRAPGTIKRAEPLRDNALAAELAGVLKDNFAVALVNAHSARCPNARCAPPALPACVCDTRSMSGVNPRRLIRSGRRRRARRSGRHVTCGGSGRRREQPSTFAHRNR
jgi:hypothetical protein